MSIIESIPNVSEGRHRDRRAPGRRDPRHSGVRLLDYSSDPSHNRSVFTLAGDAGSIKTATMALFEQAVASIDLRNHHGEHPRLGAVDVVPFVPIEGVTMKECVALALDVAASVAERFGVPIYLYEEASTNPLRKNLEDIRRGEFEGLGQKMTQAGWAPDFGPPVPHPSAGASVVGARMPLIAYNINLQTDRLDVARRSPPPSGKQRGLRYVKAMGIALEARHRSGVDEPDELREDSNLPCIRSRSPGGA
jgi:glutamate formiminotransferase